MNWSEKVFAYCERGHDPGFWAEPLNAATNAAFIVVALAALVRWRAARGGASELLLIAIVFAIGIGSFLFHTLATRSARLADVVPIGVFMIAYLAIALRRLLGFGWRGCAVGMAVFASAVVVSGTFSCAGSACANGSLGYIPALAALIAVGAALHRRGDAAARHMLWAATVFALSLTLRALDRSMCPVQLLQPGWRVGTHALWHILNALVLHLLLMVAAQRKVISK